MQLYTKNNLSQKERLIIKEMKSYGYDFYYVKFNFAKLNMGNIKFSLPLDKMSESLAITIKNYDGNGEIQRIVIASIPTIKKAIKDTTRLRKKYEIEINGIYVRPKSTIIEIMVHELAHIILFEDHIFSFYPSIADIPDFNNKMHGMSFSEVYSELCNKYKIKYPDPRYFVG